MEHKEVMEILRIGSKHCRDHAEDLERLTKKEGVDVEKVREAARLLRRAAKLLDKARVTNLPSEEKCP